MAGGARRGPGWDDDAYGAGHAAGSYADLARGTPRRADRFGEHYPEDDGGVWASRGHAGDGYPEEGYPEAAHPAGGYAEDGYPEDGYPEDGYPEDGYPEDGWAEDAYAEEGVAYPEHGGYLDADGHWVYEDDEFDAGIPPGRRGYGHSRGRVPRRRHPVRTAILALLLAFVLVVVGLFVHLEGEISPGGHPGKLVSVTIPAGTSSAEIGSILARAGVIHGSSLFRYYVKLKGDGPLLPGTYRLAVNEKYDQAIAALTAGPPVITERLIIPEGFTLRQVAARLAALPRLGLSAAKFMAAATSGAVRSPYEPPGVNNLEGLVYPATYEITGGSTETDVLQKLVARFDQEAASLNLTRAAAALGVSPYQVITVASIVEREAKLDVDRGPVASAIYNRLKVGMPLGADSTLVYALRQRDPSISVSSIDYNQPNPYNTRLNKGLPPTPIANAGAPSLAAAAAPPSTTYLYFVETNPDGKLSFASTSHGFADLEAQCRAANLC